MQREQWHLTEGLIFAHFAVFIFVHGSSMFMFFISMLILWIMARPLEESWGSPRFLVFWLVATFGASLTAVAVGRLLFGDIGFGTCLLFTSSLSYGLVAGLANVAGTSAGYLFFLATRRMPTRRKLMFEFKKRKADTALEAESEQAEGRNLLWDPRVRAADARARETGALGEEDETLLAKLDAAKDPAITVCAPSEFDFIDDDVCRQCTGYAECAARRIRMSADDA